jgi:transaldolase
MTDNDDVHSPKKRKTDNGHAYDALANMTVIVCDTGEINAIKKFTPTDATTNPSLLLKAAIMPEYEKYLKDAIGNDNNRI